MSSDEDYPDAGGSSSAPLQGSKKRRIQRACDICRRKKVRCDGPEMPNNRCSNCIAYNSECTYVEAAKKRGPPKGYVEGLENRLEKLESLLSKISPETDLSAELAGIGEGPNRGKNTTMADPTQSSPSVGLNSVPGSLPPSGSTPEHDDDGLALSDDEYAHESLAQSMKALELHPIHHRFFGKSSGIMLVQKAIDLKREYAGLDPIMRPYGKVQKKDSALVTRRPQFWLGNPWEKPSEEEGPAYIFPPDDLLPQLVEHYFANVNIFFPLLHRPSFLAAVAAGRHRGDAGFAGVLMLVCAVGSRFTDDPRVLLDGGSTFSAGWKWFEQLEMVRRSMLTPPKLTDLQHYCLSVLFLQGSSAPQSIWTMVGIGIRLAQDVGAHRRKMYSQRGSVDDEPWKRAFWVLVCLDRFTSSALGRPCAIQDEDFDLDLPIDCDDEYWDTGDPEKDFKQPPGKPSHVSAFMCFIKLSQILAFALRTIYSINKSKILLGFVGQQWEQHIVAELDSALNKWVDSVPDHIRWDPHNADLTFLAQSASIYAMYYHLQILIHRPFIPSPRKPSPLSFPSLAICTNAARSCSHIVDVERRRAKIPIPYVQMAVFSSAVVLLLNIWGGKRSGLSTDPHKEMEDVLKCMNVLKAHESRWHSSGRLWDVIYELTTVSQLPLPSETGASPSNKRERDAESPMSSSSTPSASGSSQSAPEPRPVAGSRRAQAHIPSTAATTSFGDDAFVLPMYSGDLGRMPLHGSGQTQSSFNPQAHPPHTSSTPQQDAAGMWFGLGLDPPTGPAAGQGQSNMSDAFPMDQLFFDHMASNLAAGSTFGPAPAQSQSQFGPQMQAPFIDDTVAMWSDAPSGFQLDDWGSYASHVGGMPAQHQPQHLQPHEGAAPRGDHSRAQL